MGKQYERLLKSVMGDAMTSGRVGSKYLESKVQRIWEQKMGATVNQYTTSVAVRRSKVYIAINSASLKSELSMGKDKIIDLINRELGSETIVEVIIQ